MSCGNAAAVDESAGKLQKYGAIRYRTARLQLSSELRSCECYAVVKEESDRLLAKQSKT